MSSGNDEQETIVAAYRRRLLADLHGTVVEIGPGSGPNLAYLPVAPDLHWIGIEPNPYMHPYLRAAANRLGLAQPDLRTGSAEHTDVPAESAETVICTYVLCSVTDQQAVLREVLRVLKPGGRFIFIEHVAESHGTRLRTMQNVISPLWQFVGDGCHPNRETWHAFETAGFAHLNYERFSVPIPIVGPHIAGIAVK